MQDWTNATDAELMLEAVRQGVTDKVKMHQSSMDEGPPRSVLEFIKAQLTHSPGYGVTVLGRSGGYLSIRTRETLIGLIRET